MKFSVKDIKAVVNVAVNLEIGLGSMDLECTETELKELNTAAHHSSESGEDGCEKKPEGLGDLIKDEVMRQIKQQLGGSAENKTSSQDDDIPEKPERNLPERKDDTVVEKRTKVLDDDIVVEETRTLSDEEAKEKNLHQEAEYSQDGEEVMIQGVLYRKVK